MVEEVLNNKEGNNDRSYWWNTWRFWPVRLGRSECLHSIAGGFTAGKIYDPDRTGKTMGCPGKLVDNWGFGGACGD